MLGIYVHSIHQIHQGISTYTLVSHQIDNAIISAHTTERRPITNGKMQGRYIAYGTELILTGSSYSCLSGTVPPFIGRFRVSFHQCHVNHIVGFVSRTCQTSGTGIGNLTGITNYIGNKSSPILIIDIWINRLHIIVNSRNAPTLCIIYRNTVLGNLHDIYQLMQQRIHRLWSSINDISSTIVIQIDFDSNLLTFLILYCTFTFLIIKSSEQFIPCLINRILASQCNNHPLHHIIDTCLTIIIRIRIKSSFSIPGSRLRIICPCHPPRMNSFGYSHRSVGGINRHKTSHISTIINLLSNDLSHQRIIH